jgi:hypothetical protein
METDAKVDQRLLVELSAESMSGESSNDDAWLPDAEERHAGNNILEWLSYLPDDCVNTMIEMGWDAST